MDKDRKIKIENARKYLTSEKRREIGAIEVKLPTTEYSIDWGSRPRGQGCRKGNMVQGAMSACPTGIKTYRQLDYSGYPELQKEEYSRYMKSFEFVRYIQAYTLTQDHYISSVYALTCGG